MNPILALSAVLLAPLITLQAVDIVDMVNRPYPVITSPNGKLTVTTGMDRSRGITYTFEAKSTIRKIGL